MSDPIEPPSISDRTRERMGRLGIPQGTDDPTLLALGAKPLPADEPPFISEDDRRLILPSTYPCVCGHDSMDHSRVCLPDEAPRYPCSRDECRCAEVRHA